MTKEAFNRILTQLEGKTKYLYYHLMGEPLTHPDLPLFLRKAKARGFSSQITTNGTLLDKCGQAILAAGVHKVNISLHSFEEGDDTAFFSYLDKVIAFSEMASAEGVIVVLRLWNQGCDEGKNATILSYLRTKIEGEWVETARGYRLHNKLHLEWGDRFVWPDSEAPIQGSKVFCYGLRDHFGILCDGTVVPCCLDSEGVINLGNILTDNLDSILFSDRAQAMVKGFNCRCATEELCCRCGYAQRFNK